MANNEHIQMKRLQVVGTFELEKRKRIPAVVFGEASPKPVKSVSRGGHLMVFEMDDASFVVISQN